MPKWVTITATNMSRKTMIMIGMIIGSVAGGYLPGLLGADGFSLAPTKYISQMKMKKADEDFRFFLQF